VSATFSVSSGLWIGLEGPLVHIGSCVAVLTLYLFPWLKYWWNDKEKQFLVAVGSAVGIAVTFGAPVGGVLFAYEISWNSSFWTAGAFLRTYVATAVGVYTYTLLWELSRGDINSVWSFSIIPLRSNSYFSNWRHCNLGSDRNSRSIDRSDFQLY